MGERPRVVVGVDGSAGSGAALRFALRDAARRGAGVRVVSVVMPLTYAPEAVGLAPPPSLEEVASYVRGIARRMVGEVVADAPELAAVPVELEEPAGRAGRVLVERSRDADLLVVGHRGRGGVASAVLGSVGLHCVLHARCPVAVVRPPARPRPDERAAEPAVATFGPLF